LFERSGQLCYGKEILAFARNIKRTLGNEESERHSNCVEQTTLRTIVRIHEISTPQQNLRCWFQFVLGAARTESSRKSRQEPHFRLLARLKRMGRLVFCTTRPKTSLPRRLLYKYDGNIP
jgi:hypothetical protein